MKGMSDDGSSVMVRGTIGEPSLDSLMGKRHQESMSVPFYCGHLASLDADAATLILDATLRKSISFSFLHLFKEFVPSCRSPDILPQLRLYRGGPGLLLALLKGASGSFEHLWKLHSGGGRSVYEAFHVGNQVIPTLPDLDISLSMMGRLLDSHPQAAIASMRWEELRELASKVRRGRRSLAGLAMEPECYLVRSGSLARALAPPPSCSEEMKSYMWDLACSEDPQHSEVELYLLSIEIEMAMMEKVISFLERGISF